MSEIMSCLFRFLLAILFNIGDDCVYISKHLVDGVVQDFLSRQVVLDCSRRFKSHMRLLMKTSSSVESKPAAFKMWQSLSYPSKSRVPVETLAFGFSRELHRVPAGSIQKQT